MQAGRGGEFQACHVRVQGRGMICGCVEGFRPAHDIQQPPENALENSIYS